MAEITLEKTHALLEQLAEYVMTQVSSKQEVNELRREMNEKLELKADKTELKRVDHKADMLLEGQDGMVKSLDIIQTEIKAISGTLDNHEKRLADLEVHNFGSKVRDKNNPNYYK